MALNDRSLKTLRLENLQKINLGNRRVKSISVDFSHINPKFVGTFVVHHPSQIENIEIGVIRAELLNGNLNVDEMTDNLVTSISSLEVVLDSYPEWYNPFDPELDYEILEHLFVEYIKWVNSFRLQRTTKPTGDSSDRPSEVRVVDTENVQNPTNG